MAQVSTGPAPSGPLSSHPPSVASPPPTANATAPEQWTFQTPNGTIVSPASPPRRGSSKRPMSSSSGEWFSGTKKLGERVHHQKHNSLAGNTRPPGGNMTLPTISPPRSKVTSNPTRSTPPPPDQLQTMTENLISGHDARWSEQKEKILLGPFDYIDSQPGKDVRTQLISAFNCWLKVPEESLKVVTRVVGMLHNASLLVDDVEDSSNLRRGIPVAHSLFGVPQTINSANYIYFLALQSLTALPNASAALSIYTEELLNLHRGQGMDLYWRDTLTCPSESDYLEMVSNKTGGLFRLAVKLMQAESRATTTSGDAVNCIPLIQAISLYFQILDDLLNLQSPTYAARKGLCEDLTEGKFSFPVIHAIRADATNLELINILRMKSTDDNVKKYAVGYMERVGSFDYTKAVLADLERKTLALIAEIERLVGGEEGRRGAEQIKAIIGKLKAL